MSTSRSLTIECMFAVVVVARVNDDEMENEMAREMHTQYIAHKYAELTRWEFRFWDDNDGEIDMRHIVVFDTVNERNFCVISFAEMQHETDVQKRVHEYAVDDVDNIAPNSELRFEWADAIVRGIMDGLRQTMNAHA